ncbi:SHOCT domain-containing protein [Candidatus Micrarchaeota archaeon]|nr:SHOCT domain-containing protein [Candidatus Micrarchaeota archaeon]
MMSYPYGDRMGYGGWGWIVGVVFWALVIVALVLLIYWLFRSLRGTNQAVSASELLKQRYALGEITKKQFDEMKKDLESG